MKQNQITDLITALGTANGSVAQQLAASGFNINALRTAAVLRKDEWVQFDQRVVQVARTRLGAVADLISRGLVYNISNAMGTTVVSWDQGGDMTAAEVSMDGLTPGRGDRTDFTQVTMPLPIIHKDFSINLRTLEASRRNIGTGVANLDTTQAAIATRLVSEKIESILFSGASLTHANGTIYGYTNHPNRVTGGTGLDWANTAGVTGDQIVQEVIAMIGSAAAVNHFGPFALYIPVGHYNRLLDDYKTYGDRTILERLLAIPEIDLVRGTADLTANNHVLVDLNVDTVDMVMGQQPIPVMWDTDGGFKTNFKVMAIMVPRIKADSAGSCGVVHNS